MKKVKFFLTVMLFFCTFQLFAQSEKGLKIFVDGELSFEVTPLQKKVLRYFSQLSDKNFDEFFSKDQPKL